ncbi:hypothetical protein D1007_19847 [Hordeum vulgare]|nr:hypothetical protein D1007_19847 [Hordeum vulgare]
MDVMEAKERLPKETKGKAKEKDQAWDDVQSVLNKEEVEEVDFLQPYLHLLSPSLIELLRFCETTRARNTFLTREVVLLEKHIAYLQVEDRVKKTKAEATKLHEFSITKCMDVLKTMEDVARIKKIKAFNVFKDAANREIFINVVDDDKDTAIMWLRSQMSP